MEKDPNRFYRPYPREGDVGALSAFLIFLSTVTLLLVVAIASGVTFENLFVTGRAEGVAVADNTGPSPQAASVARTPTRAPASSALAPTAVVPTPQAGKPTATPTPPPTPVPETQYAAVSAGGDGVWLRRSPRMDDRLVAWADGARMQVIGPDVQAEGRAWRHVRDPRGNEGYVPAEWLAPAQ